MTEEPLIFNGKKYISSRRASEISGYHIDYLGQLSRKGELESEMVGRNRYLSEESLFTYLHKASFKGQNFSPAKKTKKTAPEIAQNLIQNKTAVLVNSAVTNAIPEIAVSGVQRQSFVHPIQAALPHQKSPLKISQIALVFTCAMLALTFSLPATRAGLSNFAKSISALYPSYDVHKSAVSTQEAQVYKTGTIGFPTLSTLDKNYFDTIHALDQSLISLGVTVREFVLRLSDNVLVVIGRMRHKEDDTQIVQNGFLPTGTPSSNDTPSDGNSNGVVSEEMLRKILDEELNKRFSEGQTPDTGMVVVPTTGTPTGDAALKAKIQNSFSDNVQVELDSSKTAGVIRPEFKNATNDNYMFVLVPIK